MASYDALLKNLPPIIGLVVLVLVLLFVLVNFGYLRACDIPGFSGIYYAIKGNPTVAIVTGDDGSGDPTYLRGIIAKEIHMAPIVLDSDKIFDSSALSSYQVVIVEHARTMSTQTLWAFQKYVQGGGKLVWIGDAGTKLGKKDYVCEKAEFAYRPAVYTKTAENESQEVCGEWVTVSPNSLDNSEDGLCGKTFGDVVVAFVGENRSTYESATTGQFHLCAAETEPYIMRNTEKITDCLAEVGRAGLGITVSNVNSICTNFNYWQRGVSETAGGDKIASLDFSQQVLRIDFIEQFGAENMFMAPSGGMHPLTRGYESGTDVDFTSYFGVANVSLVDSSRFSSVPTASAVMTMDVNGETYPAVIVSTPYLQINRNGQVVYFAFPPDDLIKAGGAGTRLINNLFEFLTC